MCIIPQMKIVPSCLIKAPASSCLRKLLNIFRGVFKDSSLIGTNENGAERL